MLRELMIWLVTVFMIGPFQQEMSRAVGGQAPQAVVQQVEECAGVAAPAIVERATAHWWWALATVVRVWIGFTSIDAVVLEVAPACAPAIQTMQRLRLAQGNEA